MNKIILIGNLTHDPDVRSTTSGITVCSFSIAVNRRFATQGGERQTDFFRINAWRQLGETCSRYLTKGRKVAVIGELQARTYEAKDGTTRMSLEVSADEVEFLTPRSQDEGQQPQGSDYRSDRQNAPAVNDPFAGVSSDDIPF
ncbi:MAG TPA: single-stranded DNA-binding protein [Eubacteriales bacterium]|nr:single-stranded DNA-binding protein [Clostridia bacterium]HRV72533.1 single-stranded DNA-binding protein [Eubacteriales bacterium]